MSSTMVKDKSKALWDASTTKVFIDLCIEQLHKGERKGTMYTKKAGPIFVMGSKKRQGKSMTDCSLKTSMTPYERNGRCGKN